MMKILRIFLIPIALSACQQTTAIPLAQNIVQINVSAAPICGGGNAQKAAFNHAAVQTLRSGFDKFIIGGSQYQNNVRVSQGQPTSYTTTGTGTITPTFGGYNVAGQSTTVANGATPIISGTHDHSVIVKMFKADDPQSQNALDAKTVLGSEWQSIIAKDKNTCF